jgi:signal transduction histidine kinase
MVARAERRMELLLAVTGELAGARTHQDIARIAVEKGFDAVGASYGGIWLVDAGARELRLLEVSPLPRGDIGRWAVVPLDIDAPLPQAARTGEPVFLESLGEFEARFPASFARIRETISSANPAYAHLPLFGKGVPIGAFAVTYERAEDLDVNERTFLSILAHQCGLAIARVQSEQELERAYREEQAAHLEAKAATRAREEILSVVSHDLRNPLGTILIGAQTLMQLRDAKDPQVAVIASRILRQSERMARLIEDLVDFAGIQAGQLTIDRKQCAPEAIVAQAAEQFAPVGHERGLIFEIQTAPDLPDIEADCDRGVQVFASLLSNSVRATPRNGRIAIGATLEDTEVVFFVRDTGPGIAPDELPSLFERYWRSEQPSYKGAGLGLSIARGIVEAHAGRIWADSQLGAGSTFWFTLAPRLPQA